MRPKSVLVAAALAALVLPGCPEYDGAELKIANAGASDVRVHVRYRDSEDDYDSDRFVLAPQTWIAIETDTRWAELNIVRVSDGMVLFDDELDRSDFGRDHEAVVTVFP